MSSTRKCKKHGILPIKKFCIYQTSNRGKIITRYDCKLCAADKREKHKEYYVGWRNKNRKKLRAYWKKYAKQKSDKVRKFILSYLATHSCVDCPEMDIRCLEFDHVRGKKKCHISDMIHRGSSLERVKKEIAKCEVRCANCHRRKTFNSYESCYRTR